MIKFKTRYTILKRVFYPEYGIFSINGDSSFEALKKEALPTQNNLFKSFNKSFELIEFLISESPEDYTKKLKSNSEFVIKMVTQNSMTSLKTNDEIISKNKRIYWQYTRNY